MHACALRHLVAPGLVYVHIVPKHKFLAAINSHKKSQIGAFTWWLLSWLLRTVSVDDIVNDTLQLSVEDDWECNETPVDGLALMSVGHDYRICKVDWIMKKDTQGYFVLLYGDWLKSNDDRKDCFSVGTTPDFGIRKVQGSVGITMASVNGHTNEVANEVFMGDVAKVNVVNKFMGTKNVNGPGFIFNASKPNSNLVNQKIKRNQGYFNFDGQIADRSTWKRTSSCAMVTDSTSFGVLVERYKRSLGEVCLTGFISIHRGNKKLVRDGEMENNSFSLELGEEHGELVVGSTTKEGVVGLDDGNKKKLSLKQQARKIGDKSGGELVAELCGHGDDLCSSKVVAINFELLDRFGEGVRGPWLCGGDMNEILDNFEKHGGPPRGFEAMARFRWSLDYCALKDLSKDYNTFTWCNGHWDSAGDVLSAKVGSCPSVVWRSLLLGEGDYFRWASMAYWVRQMSSYCGRPLVA
ncbi:hypothetical protein F8388_020832 [Cannabis sativa]|uniref:Uncharacterized protein n=1 Tax=Cannabis sativa TaxID=3483 RepID=A0A7J6FKF8_CANSA|nr:hypothetical protein F8388_020832 [Cannabis sativa]